MMNYGIQLFSLRDLAGESLEKAVEEVAKLGYASVEFAGFYGRSAQEVNAMLEKNNIKLHGTHTGINELIENYDATVAFHKEIGNKNLIIPHFGLGSQAEIDMFIDLVNKYEPMLAKEGIKLSFHNHSAEFQINADGSEVYPQLISRTNIGLEIDTYWVFNAGLDPIQTLEKYKDRLVCIHLKDGVENGSGRPLGQGIAPVKAVREKAIELNVPIIVESETITPSGLDEARMCMEYLKTLEN